MVVLVLALTPPAAHATTGTWSITSDTTLSENHFGSIVINADDITLDCAGFSLIGPGDIDDGIVVQDRSGVTVQNCNVAGFPGRGFRVSDSVGVSIRQSSAVRNGLSGFLLDRASQSLLEGDEARGNGLEAGYSGFDVYPGSTGNEIRGNRSTENGGNGFYIEGAAGNTFEINEAVGNRENGFAIGGSHDNRFLGNRATHNDARGWYVQDGTGLVMTGNEAIANTFDGFEAHASSGMIWTGNSASGSRDFGFLVTEDSNGGTFEENTSIGNGFGFAFENGGGHQVTGNVARDNVERGIAVWNSDDNVVMGNTSERNGGGFELYGSSGNQLANNVARASLVYEGIVLTDSTGSVLRGNVSERNPIGLALYGSSGNVFSNNRFIANGPDGWGVWIADSSNENRFANNIAQGNDYEGFTIAHGSSGNELVANVSRGSNYQGISLYFGADHNVVRGNVTTGNAGSGVLVVQSSHNSITNNQAMRNNQNLLDPGGGITVIEESSFNQILRNVACNNGNWDGYDDGTGTENTWEANVFCTTSGVPTEELEVYFDDLEGFNLAADSPAVAVTFDDLATPSNITGETLAGVGFRAGDAPPPSAPLEVVAGADTFTIEGDFGGVIDASTNQLLSTSGENVLSPGGAWLAPGPDPLTENDDLDLRFPAAVRAVGFDILFQSLDCCSYVAITVFGPSGEVLYFNPAIPTGSEGEGGDPAGPVFVGFVSTSMSIARILVNEYDGNNEYPDSNIGYDTFRLDSV